MAQALWSELARKHRVSRERPDTWTIAEPRGLGALRKAGAFDRLASPSVVAAIDALPGRADWPQPFSRGDPLVTFPTPGVWDVPLSGRHIDFPARSALLLKWLGYLAPVEPAGGGTVVLAGSHRLVAHFLRRAGEAEPGRSPTVRDAIFDAHPWLNGIRRPGPATERVARFVERGAHRRTGLTPHARPPPLRGSSESRTHPPLRHERRR